MEEYTPCSAWGAAVKVIMFGATVTQWSVPDAGREFGECHPGDSSTCNDYEKRGPYFGAVCGRVVNRIAGRSSRSTARRTGWRPTTGRITCMAGSRGMTSGCGAPRRAGQREAPSVKFSLVDSDGMEGYPGTLRVSVTYTLTGGTLRLEYVATTDKPTPFNPSNHTYFNLKDAGRTDILGHIVQINADAYTPTDENLIPTGEIKAVKGTALDFTAPKAIGRDIGLIHAKPQGYDHNFVLRSRDGSLAQAAVVEELSTGRRMEVWTTQPGVQLYTGNSLDGSITGQGGIAYKQHHALCLETQHFPDAVHHDAFPSTILRPGATYRQVTEYRFSTTSPLK